MAPHDKEFSADLKRRIVALHEDGQVYKKIANPRKLSCSAVANIIQRFKRAGSTQNRPRIGCPEKLSACAERKWFLWKVGIGVLSALLQRLKWWGISLLVLRPYAALYIKLVCMAVTQTGSLFWRRYTRKPAKSLLKTCQQNTWITGAISYVLMRWRIICLVPMASSMCGGDLVRITKISVSCLEVPVV